jgi:hypothetical protein
LAAFHLVRLALIPAFCWTAVWAVEDFLPRRKERNIALTLFFLGSGLGGITRRLACQDPTCGSGDYFPPDTWVAEFTPLQSLTFSPHFVASWILLLASVSCCYKAYTRDSTSLAVLGGLLALLLFQFHPYYVPFVWGVATAVFTHALLHKKRTRAAFVQCLLFVGISAASVLYHLWIAIATTNGKWIFGATKTPSPVLLTIGLGAFITASYRGIILLRARETRERLRLYFLLLLPSLHFLLAYSPLSFNRRFLEGLLFPLAVLSAPAVAAFLTHRSIGIRVARLVAVTALFGSTTIDTIDRQVEVLSNTARRQFFVEPLEYDALMWMGAHLPSDAVVLSSIESGSLIAGLAIHRVFAGHWAQTIFRTGKMAEIRSFFRCDEPNVQLRYLRVRGITHVFVGPSEIALGVRDQAFRALKNIYSNGPYTVFRVP